MTATYILDNNKQAFLNGGGEMGEYMRAINWDDTPLGSPMQWPLALKQTVSIALSSTLPMLILWGDEHSQLYNDAFKPIIGSSAHLASMFQEAMDGKSTGFSDFKVTLERSGYLEDCYFDLSCSPIRNEEGSVGGALIIATETTDKVRAIANLQRSEKIFKSIALNIPKSLIILIDKHQRYMTVEGDILEELGDKNTDYIGKHTSEADLLGVYADTQQLYAKVLSGEKFSQERIANNGESYVMHFVPLTNDDKEVEAAIVIALDITHFKQDEERSAKLAAIIESSDDAIISKTLESIITSWNDSAVRMFGYTADEIIGQSIYKLIPKDRQDEEPKILARLSRGERVEHFETKRLTKYGTLIDVSLTISPVKNKQGEIIGLSKIIRDITYKKQEEQRKNDFVAVVSHELKTPLTTIHSYIQLLLARSQKEENEFYIKALSRAEVQTKKMAAMINDFLSVARLEEGEISINKTLFEFHPLALESLQDVQFLTTKHEIVLVDCAPIWLNGDRDKLGQVLNNLLTNAIKYAPNGGKITLGCEIQGTTVKIYVRDEGVGIKLEDQKRLFDRFYRSDNEKLKTISGFGIGLYLVSEILRHHDSKIEVVSQENIGSTFYFQLPFEA